MIMKFVSVWLILIKNFDNFGFVFVYTGFKIKFVQSLVELMNKYKVEIEMTRNQVLHKVKNFYSKNEQTGLG